MKLIEQVMEKLGLHEGRLEGHDREFETCNAVIKSMMGTLDEVKETTLSIRFWLMIFALGWMVDAGFKVVDVIKLIIPKALAIVQGSEIMIDLIHLSSLL